VRNTSILIKSVLFTAEALLGFTEQLDCFHRSKLDVRGDPFLLQLPQLVKSETLRSLFQKKPPENVMLRREETDYSKLRNATTLYNLCWTNILAHVDNETHYRLLSDLTTLSELHRLFSVEYWDGHE
jgi:hypothetical protein